MFCHCCGSAWHRIRERERERERESRCFFSRLFAQPPLTHESCRVQDTVLLLGPLLFLCHRRSPTIPSPRDSQIPSVPFRRSPLIHSEISDFSDHNTLQEDLKSLESGAKELSMQFNATKCNIMPGMVPIRILLLPKQHHHPESLHQPVPGNPTL